MLGGPKDFKLIVTKSPELVEVDFVFLLQYNLSHRNRIVLRIDEVNEIQSVSSPGA